MQALLLSSLGRVIWRMMAGCLVFWILVPRGGAAEFPEENRLPGTEPLQFEGDIASNMVAGVDRFLLSQLDDATRERDARWSRDFSSPEASQASLRSYRERLAHILGLRDPRTPWAGLELVTTTTRDSLLGRGAQYEIRQVRWAAFGEVHGEGLLIEPLGRAPMAHVIALPDADQTPEQLVGLTEGVPVDSQFARVLAEQGCRVIVPVLISRAMEKRHGRANLSHREFIYRPAFELGRHLLGYELLKVLALIDGIEAEHGGTEARVGVCGYGEGGGLALYAGALDSRIDSVAVSGCFGSRQRAWEEPIDRNVFGLLTRFGGAELAAMIRPRPLSLEAARAPELTLPGEGGAPAILRTPALDEVRQEATRAARLLGDEPPSSGMHLIIQGEGMGPFGSTEWLRHFLSGLGDAKPLDTWRPGERPEPVGALTDADERQRRQVRELDRHSQWLLGESGEARRVFMKDLDTTSPEAYARSVEAYREKFRNEVIGWFDLERSPARPRSRLAYDEPGWRGYEVVLDVFPDVIAYGVLLVPKGMGDGEKRPVVVCQHGLEGRPRDVIRGDHPAYHDFAARLAERGFVTFAPQNLYLFTDRFRTLQRKANLLGKTLFSIITPQHQQWVDWLQTLPFVDPDRVAFYGLSYGGKTAMRVPALVTNYCMSICSADFNEWVWKNASTRSPYSYVWTGEYEIFEFDLGGTFNYAEMAALIAPRPFMVERGHWDGVAPDESVAYEYAKVRHLYAAKLKLADRCAIEWFDGPHTIHGRGTFEFLHRHLRWPIAR